MEVSDASVSSIDAMQDAASAIITDAVPAPAEVVSVEATVEATVAAVSAPQSDVVANPSDIIDAVPMAEPTTEVSNIDVSASSDIAVVQNVEAAASVTAVDGDSEAKSAIAVLSAEPDSATPDASVESVSAVAPVQESEPDASTSVTSAPSADTPAPAESVDDAVVATPASADTAAVNVEPSSDVTVPDVTSQHVLSAEPEPAAVDTPPSTESVPVIERVSIDSVEFVTADVAPTAATPLPSVTVAEAQQAVQQIDTGLKLHASLGFPADKRNNLHYIDTEAGVVLYASGNSFQLLTISQGMAVLPLHVIY